MDTGKTREEMTAALRAAFPSDERDSRPGGGNKQYTYVPGENVLERLIDATGNCFSTRILSDPIILPQADAEGMVKGHLWVVRVALEIPGLGSREALGVQMMLLGSGEDLLKGCVTDGIKKAATQFGTGLEIYHEATEQKQAAKGRGQQKQVQQRSTPAAPQQNGSAPQVEQPHDDSPQNWTVLWNRLRTEKGIPDGPALQKLTGRDTKSFGTPGAAWDAVLQAQK